MQGRAALSLLRGASRTQLTRPVLSQIRPAVANFATVNEFDSHDHNYDDVKVNDPSKRAFSYFVLGGSRFLYATAARLLLVKFVGSMSASADVLALASAEFDLSAIDVGSTVTVKWRGKPVFIRHRTQSEIDDANSVSLGELRDPETDADRTQDPNWLVVLGVCTHLGCVPLSNAGDFGGWFCPCHGSHYDISARIRKGPAPLNMEIPPYKFLTEDKLLIG
jgi:ubiquinol-cytochrome c reductase iron-sulfur subunit